MARSESNNADANNIRDVKDFTRNSKLLTEKNRQLTCHQIRPVGKRKC